MRRFRIATWGACGLAAAGCFSFDEQRQESFFRKPEPQIALPTVSPGSTEAASRVDGIGRGILAANPQIGAKPLFRTIGAPQPEVFHRGTDDVYVTEGLVRLCETDGQLAAVLCAELAKMVAEREAAAPASVRRPERLPPIDIPVASDGLAGAPDHTRLRELADYEKQKRQQARQEKLPPPDPQRLCEDYLRTYLLRSGYKPQDIDAAAPVLHAAARNFAFEQQMGAALPGVAPTSAGNPVTAPGAGLGTPTPVGQ
jgi:hypothetical protein